MKGKGQQIRYVGRKRMERREQRDVVELNMGGRERKQGKKTPEHGKTN